MREKVREESKIEGERETKGGKERVRMTERAREREI